jgi:hypothetical protein
MITLPPGTIKRIHVNQHNIRHNGKTGDRREPLTVKTSRGNFVGHDVVVDGPSRVVYSPDNPLSCGAKVWVETTSEVTVK